MNGNYKFLLEVLFAVGFNTLPLGAVKNKQRLKNMVVNPIVKKFPCRTNLFEFCNAYTIPRPLGRGGSLFALAVIAVYRAPFMFRGSLAEEEALPLEAAHD